MKCRFLTTEEIFVIPIKKDDFIFYAPFLQLVFTGNKDMAKFLSLIKHNNLNWKMIDNKDKTIEKLTKIGLLSKTKSRMEDVFRNPNIDIFQRGVTLLMTTDCNLRCLYCFAFGGEKKKRMKWEIAKSAVDYCLKDIKKGESFNIIFHGGGEPTLAWNLLKKIVAYSKNKCKENRTKINFIIGTNGILSESQVRFMIENNFFIKLSIDGPPKIQNRLRPLKDGSESYEFLRKTIGLFNKLNADYEARTTITKDSVKYMLTIVKHFKKLGIKKVHLEPCFECGRCLTTDTKGPPIEEFIKQMIRCLNYSKNRSISIKFSGQRLGTIYPRFCGAAGYNMFVTPEGYVSSCAECQTPEDSASKIFFYGKIDSKTKKLKIDKSKLGYLRNRSVINIPECKDCFCKWHCSGGCLIRNWRSTKSIFKIDKNICRMNKKIQLWILKEFLKNENIILDGCEIKPQKLL